MTTGKPPGPNKTLVGMPSDLKAVLDNLDRQKAQPVAAVVPADEASGEGAGSSAAPTPRDPRAPQSPAGASGRPPPLPSPSPSSSPPAQRPGSQPLSDRTLIGMPADMHAPPHAAGSEARAAAVPPPIASSAPAPHAVSHPHAAERPMLVQQVRAVGISDSSGSQLHEAPTAPAVPGSTAASEAASADDRAQDEHLPRRSGPAASELLGLGRIETVAADQSQRSRLALPLARGDLEHDQTVLSRRQPGRMPRRWIMITAIATAALAAAGMVATRAAKQFFSAAAGSTSSSERLPASGVEQSAASERSGGDLPQLPLSPGAGETPALGVTTDTSAATAPELRPTATNEPQASAALVDHSPSQPSAVMSAPLTGANAELEKRAIEQLIANDYPAAKQLYERLRVAEPTRAEYAVMIELLNRTGATACGQPGQPPCAAP